VNLEVKLARTSSELDELFQCRHRVFVEQEQYMPPLPDRRINDRYDAFPTTGNVVAKIEGRVAGGFRVMEHSAVGTSADAFFDFDLFLPPEAKRGAVSLLCLERQYRPVPGALLSMLRLGFHWALERGLTHLVGACNPDVRRLFISIGFSPVAPQFYDQGHGLQVLPMILELRALNNRFLSFIDQQRLAPGAQDNSWFCSEVKHASIV
jgi:hypothetical protein